MKKAIVFGIGENMFRAYSRLVSNYEIVAFLDNNESAHGNKIADAPITSIKNISSFVYDFIIITPSNHEPIRRQLLELGIKRENIMLLRDMADYSYSKSTLTIAFCLSGNLTNYLIAANYMWHVAKSILPNSHNIDVYSASGNEYAHFAFDNSDLARRIYDFSLSKDDFVNYDMVVELDSYPNILYYDEYILSRIAPKIIDYILDCKRFHILYGQILGKESFMRNRWVVYQEITGRMWLQISDISEKYKYPLPMSKESVFDFPVGGGAFITICSTQSGTVRDWPKNYWDSLRSCLLDAYAYYWILDIVGIESGEYSVIWICGDKKISRRLSLSQIALLMRETILFISADNSLVRLRYALHGGASIVLFGPTSEKVGGCPGNENIRGLGCKHWCEGVSKNWERNCLLGEEPSPCMASITPEWVMEIAEQCLGERDNDR